jgi:hypothetical protein
MDVDRFELALRIERLRLARRVRFRDLAVALAITPTELRGLMVYPERITGDHVDAIRAALKAPFGWPELEPDPLPTDPVPLTAPPLTIEEQARADEARKVVKVALEHARAALHAMDQMGADDVTRAEVAELARFAQEKMALAAELASFFAPDDE